MAGMLHHKALIVSLCDVSFSLGDIDEIPLEVEVLL
jgi:hypothetical protein